MQRQWYLLFPEFLLSIFMQAFLSTWDIFWQPVVCFDLSPVELSEHYSNLRIHGGIYSLVSIEYSLPPA